MNALSLRMLRSAAAAIVAAWREYGSAASAVDRVAPSIAARLSAVLLDREDDAATAADTVARDCLRKIRRRAVLDRMRDLRAQVAEAEARGEHARAADLLLQHRKLLQASQRDDERGGAPAEEP